MLANGSFFFDEVQNCLTILKKIRFVFILSLDILSRIVLKKNARAALKIITNKLFNLKETERFL